jgi:hypothetical protein
MSERERLIKARKDLIAAREYWPILHETCPDQFETFVQRPRHTLQFLLRWHGLLLYYHYAGVPSPPASSPGDSPSVYCPQVVPLEQLSKDTPKLSQRIGDALHWAVNKPRAFALAVKQIHQHFSDLFPYFCYGTFPAIFGHFLRHSDAHQAVLFLSAFFQDQLQGSRMPTESQALASVFLLNAFSFRQHCANIFFYRFHNGTGDPLPTFRAAVCESIPFLPAAHCLLLKEFARQSKPITASMFTCYFCVTMVTFWGYDPLFI